jgi:hypothetical protein
MAKVKRVRTKACRQCDEPKDVLYRVKVTYRRPVEISQ